MAPYGHMLGALDAAEQLHRLKLISRQELLAIMTLLTPLPEMAGWNLNLDSLPAEIQPAMRLVRLATLMPATWTFQ